MNKKISIKAIVVGVLLGLLGSSLATVIVAMIYGVPIGKIGTDYSNSSLLFFDLCLSLVAVFLGGYLAGKLGKINPIRNAVVVGVIQLAIVLLAFIPVIDQPPIWYSAATFLSIVPISYYGGKVSSTKMLDE